jgi:hypothetical protein
MESGVNSEGGGNFAFNCGFDHGGFSDNYVDVFTCPNSDADILLQTQSDDAIVYGGEPPYDVPAFPSWGSTLTTADGSSFVGVYSPSDGDTMILMYRLHD